MVEVEGVLHNTVVLAYTDVAALGRYFLFFYDILLKHHLLKSSML